MWRWLRDELRHAILSGRLKRGTRMPSTRGLAQQYECARGTIVTAFGHLLDEGYLDTRKGAGTFVALALPEDLMPGPRARVAPAKRPSVAGLSKRGEATVTQVSILPASRSVGKAFRGWEPAIDLFPIDLWARLTARIARRAPRSFYGQGDARGHAPLRKAIAEYVGSARGVSCTPDHIVITAGAQQAFDLCARLLLDPGDAVCMEDPGYPGAASAFKSAGARIVDIPVDGEGLRVDRLFTHSGRIKALYTTPSNQFPLGVTMALNRRLQLLRWALERGVWIVEDEFDAEYRYFGRPVPALKSLDESGSVIYIGTFTKMLFTSLRLGFVVLPDSLVDAFAAARCVTDRHSPTLQQAVLAEFILEGHFGHHIRHMRQVYAERCEVLVEAVKGNLSGKLDVSMASSGMRTIGWLKTKEKDSVTAARARAAGLEVIGLSQFTRRNSLPGGLLLGFGGCPPGELRRGVDVLASIL
ncbi:MocR-like pyridoxine biosynthesis transcription factor PdxR [Occallatibacter riparius]|uniref:PLP-dependent aminotransferase family protein n=1 Tax=Occallatibacter riparius TaxID=1002689 RepID=A0A9J7BH16_9BACT|nr:PLP-dependent aminotransferase family protein [Occallatibacter riparius]UWZ82031.1 PLP-dependent aminotransferase family protein [Occallatibacter riparius]